MHRAVWSASVFDSAADSRSQSFRLSLSQAAVIAHANWCYASVHATPIHPSLRAGRVAAEYRAARRTGIDESVQWKGPDRVEDRWSAGVLHRPRRRHVASGPASHAYYDGPVRNHSFRNFELRVDIMARAGANGGVYVLTEFEQVGGSERASGRFPSKGFEVQVYNGTGGPRTGSLYHVVDLDESPVRDEEWFTQTIIVKGDTIVVKINEKQVVNWTQPADWNGGREGPGRSISGPGTIALQAHDAKSAVLYKNIRIRPLD
jgi:hypothetical protein